MTLGAVAGPSLGDVTGRFAMSFGIPALAGPFMLAGFILLALLRPDPLVVAKAIEHAAVNEVEDRDVDDGGTYSKTSNKQWLIIGATVMFIAHLIMVAIMTMTPVHTEHYGHSLQAVGVVIGLHIAAMYLPSPHPLG